MCLGRREGALQSGGCSPQHPLESFDINNVDADPNNHGPCYSTVTDLARFLGWSTSWPFTVASSHANT